MSKPNEQKCHHQKTAVSLDRLEANVLPSRSTTNQFPPMWGFIAQVLPAQLYQEALSCHSAGNEILRHFWASTGLDKAVKHQRMIESLKKIRDENVKSLLIQASSLGTESLNAMKMVSDIARGGQDDRMTG